MQSLGSLRCVVLHARVKGSIWVRVDDSDAAALKFVLKQPLGFVAMRFGHNSAQYVALLDADGEYAEFGLGKLMSELTPDFFHEDNGKLYLKVRFPHAGGMKWWCREGAGAGGVRFMRIVGACFTTWVRVNGVRGGKGPFEVSEPMACARQWVRLRWNGRQAQSRGWVMWTEAKAAKGNRRGLWGGQLVRPGCSWASRMSQQCCCDIRTDIVAAWIDVALTPWHFAAQSEPLHVKRQLVDVRVASSAFL